MGGLPPIDYPSSEYDFWKAGSSGQAPTFFDARWSILPLSRMFYTYIIESLSTGKWYYGSSGDLDERLNYHNSGWNRSTNGRGPWKYIFIREFETAEQAREFEFHLKKLRRKAYIKAKYRQYFLENTEHAARLAPTKCDERSD